MILPFLAGDFFCPQIKDLKAEGAKRNSPFWNPLLYGFIHPQIFHIGALHTFADLHDAYGPYGRVLFRMKR